MEHLSQQAIATDVVIFHFSGYGGQVKMSQSVANGESAPSSKLVNSLVASGTGLIPSLSGANDLLEETLLLLGRSLSTDKFTMVLDTSHHKTSKLLQGNLRIRSFPTLSEAPNPEELAFGEQAADCLWGRVKETSLDSSNSVNPEPLFAEAQAKK